MNLTHNKNVDAADTYKHYDLISQVINLLCETGGHNLSLEQLAAHTEISPSHLQKCFKHYVGISPKQFQQNLILERAKLSLNVASSEHSHSGPAQNSILQTSLDLALSSPSRLHDVFVQLEAQTPGEFKAMGRNLHLRYCAKSSIFGPLLVVCSERGLFYLGLHEAPFNAITTLKNTYKNARFEQVANHSLLDFDPFQCQLTSTKPIKLHVSATNFQLQVWKALLNCPLAARLSYQDIAKSIGNDNASRAVGTAIGANPVAFLIPCHRVIRQSGALGGYRWGMSNKQALLSWEQALETSSSY